jgi:uracil-DNA glycosylase family 4
MKKCNLCPLRKTCTQVVPGDGPSDARIVVLGEGPGKSEDEEGRPFVGRSGQFLRAQLRHLMKHGVYISNTVRCRPPDNRDPSPAESEACWPWTLKTLQVVRPKVIVTLGKPALSVVSYKFGVKIPAGGFADKVAGKRIYVADRKFFLFPCVHPAFALRRKDARKQFTSHMKYLDTAVPGWLRRP